MSRSASTSPRRAAATPSAGDGAAPAAAAPPEGGDRSSGLLAGIDVGGTKIQVVITDGTFTRLAESRGPTPTTGGPPAVVAAIHALVETALKEAGAERVGAIGVGAPGTIDFARGIVARSPNLAGWMDPYPLGPELARLTGSKVVVDNDVRAGMLGEYRLGAGQPFEDMIGVWFGTGVGGAVILKGQLRLGRVGACGEIGHVCVQPGGRRCGCGRRGCLEAYAGRANMERRARKLAAGRHPTELFRIMEKQGRDHVTSGVIARALDAGDALTHRLVDEAVAAAGAGIASVVNVLDVEAVIIGGGLGTRLGVPFTNRVAAAMQPHLFVDGKDSVRVVPAGLGDYAGALGAATEAAVLVA